MDKTLKAILLAALLALAGCSSLTKVPAGDPGRERPNNARYGNAVPPGMIDVAINDRGVLP